MIRYGKAPFFECSSRGDKRFSAFYARVNDKTIEEQYQAFKVFKIDGRFVTGLPPAHAKGKKAINQLEAAQLYSQLWNKYIALNPGLLSVLRKASGLSDIFGQKGHCCQATELWRIRNTDQPYRVVLTDNFGMSGESPGRDERFFFGAMPWQDAVKIVDILNGQQDAHSPYFYKVEPIGYQLLRFEP